MIKNRNLNIDSNGNYSNRSMKNLEKNDDIYPIYSALTENSRKLLSSETICKMGCRSPTKCKYERSDNWNVEKEQEIKGLYSNWITDDIIASSRPASAEIERHKLKSKFQHHKIKTIINLQETNEHAFCGFILKTTGFTYTPDELDCKMYNYPIKDFGTTNDKRLLTICKLICDRILNYKERILIHCHAGRGRTGMIIAVYLIYRYRLSARAAVELVRKKRPNTIQSQCQIDSVISFSRYIQNAFIIFPLLIPVTSFTSSTSFNISQYLQFQSMRLLGEQSRSELTSIPDIIYFIIKKLLKSIINSNDLNHKSKKIIRQLFLVDDFQSFQHQLNGLNLRKGECDSLLSLFAQQTTSHHNFNCIIKLKRIIKQEIYDEKDELTNEKFSAITFLEEKIEEMTNNDLLVGLFWHWFEQLREPYLTYNLLQKFNRSIFSNYQENNQNIKRLNDKTYHSFLRLINQYPTFLIIYRFFYSLLNHRDKRNGQMKNQIYTNLMMSLTQQLICDQSIPASVNNFQHLSTLDLLRTLTSSYQTNGSRQISIIIRMKPSKLHNQLNTNSNYYQTIQEIIDFLTE
ncbi:hypothetical protein SNEBB_000732 [Seison nebaliae]|nr:hypothetical protein SNEBB_000732 [Seison nebaliae]